MQAFQRHLILAVLCLFTLSKASAQYPTASVGFVYSDVAYKNLGFQASVNICPYFMVNAYAQLRPLADRKIFGLLFLETSREKGHVLEINPAFSIPLGKSSTSGELYLGPYWQVKRFSGSGTSSVILVGASGPNSTDRHFTVAGAAGGINYNVDENVLMGFHGALGARGKDLLGSANSASQTDEDDYGDVDFVVVRASVMYRF